MKNIYKYEIKGPSDREQVLLMPKGAIPLTVQKQDGKVTMWAEIERSRPIVERKLYLFGTGWEIDTEGLSYVGTIQDGIFVWHLYISDDEINTHDAAMRQI